MPAPTIEPTPMNAAWRVDREREVPVAPLASGASWSRPPSAVTPIASGSDLPGHPASPARDDERHDQGVAASGVFPDLWPVTDQLTRVEIKMSSSTPEKPSMARPSFS